MPSNILLPIPSAALILSVIFFSCSLTSAGIKSLADFVILSASLENALSLSNQGVEERAFEYVFPNSAIP